ncbi:MAG: hypothetical protein DRG24_01130 [Epsilonproteobacteria bacterium]|nr:MAG: hypothetical protein DRG24_01130 [Campylobacterota bacterium]
MHYIFMVLILGTVVIGWADSIKSQTIGCPTVDVLKNISKETDNDYVKINLFAMANDCLLLSQKDKVEAIDYDPVNEKTLYIKIIHKQSGKVLFVPSSEIYIEQSGKKNTFRF